MKNRKINFLLFILILILVTLACNAVLPQTESTSAPAQPVISTLNLPQGQDNLPQTEAEVPRVHVDEAKLAFENGEAIIVDVRSVDAYAEGHVTGAISIPLNEFENNVGNLPLDKSQWIITYCT